MAQRLKRRRWIWVVATVALGTVSFYSVKASGIIQSLPVNFGDFVRKGQIICELDRNDLLPRLNEARAALSVNQAQIETARSDYEKYKVDAAGPDVGFLRRDRERALQMFKQGLIASDKRDEAD